MSTDDNKHIDWAEIPINEWSDFVQEIEQSEGELSVETRYLYRGQSDKKWDLTPSYVRSLPTKHQQVSREDEFWANCFQAAREMEIQSISQFQRTAHLYIDAGSLPNENEILEWLALMQHYQAPTRLLDWTKSPYVALYMAAVDNIDRDGAVWAFDSHFYRLGSEAIGDGGFGRDPAEINSFLDCTRMSTVRMFEPKRPTNRMVAQQGCFTIASDILANHNSAILMPLDPITCTRAPTAMKLIIPAWQKYKLIARLVSMNVTGSSLFPGLDGLGRSIKEHLITKK